jgi:diacylglycerol kinase (ATP)
LCEPVEIPEDPIMRACIIYNPTARGAKAERLGQYLEGLRGECTLKPTHAAGAGRLLAAEAVREGFDTIVAAGGDGTVNEVVNGIGDAPEGFERSRLAVFPMGTANVFAREIRMPVRLERAWDVIRSGKERVIDLGEAQFSTRQGVESRYFIQLAGAGPDARAVEMVSWKWKKKCAFLAYAVAACIALLERHPRISWRSPEGEGVADAVVIGNGGYYGGPFHIFPEARLDDHQMDVALFPKINLAFFACVAPVALLTLRRPRRGVEHFQTQTLTLQCGEKVGFQLDGELVGRLPVSIRWHPKKIRVVTSV